MPGQREVAIYAPDGYEITYRTGAKWDTAGIVQRTNGRWYVVANGTSANSVRRRTTKAYYRSPSLGMAVTSIWEGTAPVVRECFRTHKVTIVETFTPGKGFQAHRLNGGRKNIRRLIAEGATQITFKEVSSNRQADFQAEELAKSMRRPAAPRCSTPGHRTHPATHRVTFECGGEQQASEVCNDCRIDLASDDSVTRFQATEI